MRASTTEALARLLGHARSHVPHYQASIPPGPVTGADAIATLRRLPLLGREEVRRQRPRLWSAEGDPRRWRTVHTTGTTGPPLEIVVDDAAQQAEAASLFRHVERVTGARSGYAVFHLTLHLASVSRTSAPTEPLGIRLTKWNLSRAWQLPDAEFRPALERLGGQVITAMPSVMAALCDRLLHHGGVPVPPRLVVLSGEQVTAGLRERIARTFHCPVTTLYTLAEAGIVGYECGETGTYHVDDDAFTEVTGDGGEPLPARGPGEVVVTPLANHAMPLLRYRTGDTGVWVDGSCGCGGSQPRLKLLAARSEHVVVTGARGRDLRMIDLAKLSRHLDLGVTRVVGDAAEVTVEYQDERPATTVQRTVIAAALRSLLGIELTVRMRQVAHAATGGRPAARPGPGLPSLPDPQEVAHWAREMLAPEERVVSAVLTGSALDAAATSRFSDIDMTVVVDGDPYDENWRSLATAMNRHVATLRVNVTQAAKVAQAPLVACRLLAERHPVVGSLEEAGVRWPARHALVGEARFWAQNAESVLWTRLTSADRSRTDPLRDAWLASRYCLDALRYAFLLDGLRTTAARQVLRLAADREVPHAEAIAQAFAVGREHRPPPEAGSPEADRFLADALACVQWLGRFL
ncbi:hypothetical protein [Streptomyces sp. NPDC046197]|uniref:phenylacetate--CoA ligase family protein n=1 Tax=Streptomyces sp. NPDC046197 TaxID=3154337 RepID=UPI003400DC26